MLCKVCGVKKVPCRKAVDPQKQNTCPGQERNGGRGRGREACAGRPLAWRPGASQQQTVLMLRRVATTPCRRWSGRHFNLIPLAADAASRRAREAGGGGKAFGGSEVQKNPSVPRCVATPTRESSSLRANGLHADASQAAISFLIPLAADAAGRRVRESRWREGLRRVRGAKETLRPALRSDAYPRVLEPPRQ